MVSSFCLPIAYRAYRALTKNTGDALMPNGRICKRYVDALGCPAGKDREVLWDSDLAGFGVVAFPSGSKSYVVQYRQNGRSRRVNLGKHGRLTPDEARSEAKKLLGAVEGGADPIAQKRAARAGMSLNELAELYLTRHVEPKKKIRTTAEYRRLLKQHVLPRLGGKRLQDVKRSDVISLHLEISKQTPVTANRAMAVLSSLWGWSAKMEFVTSQENPVRGLEKNREQGRERYLTADEYRRLGDVLHEAETIGLPMAIDENNPKSKHAPKPGTRKPPIDPFAAAAMRLLLLTGARLNEIVKLQWSSVDLERGLLFLPDSKTGKKSVPLSGHAIAVLRALPRIDGNEHVVPGGKEGKPRSDLKRPWEAIRKAAGLQGLRIHDWRHSFASVGVGESMGLPIVGKLLGQKNQATTARYAHLDANPLKRAADEIGKKIVAAMAPQRSTEET
jgi:integrase